MVSAQSQPIYLDPYSILVHSKKGVVRVYCPFTVKVIKPICKYQVGELLSVDMVKSDPEGWLVYIIAGKVYWYQHFWIIL